MNFYDVACLSIGMLLIAFGMFTLTYLTLKILDGERK